MKIVITLSLILLLTACNPVESTLKEAKKESLGKSAQITAKQLQQDYALQLLEGTAPTENITNPTTCPTTTTFDSEEGTCTYTLVINNNEADFTVTIEGKGDFEGYKAVTVNGNTAEVTEISN